ncbi:MAG TPA: recombinase family protein [Urbifossiella sp.]|nr:recombinase family protein [Urbifossiella sp.]
MQRAISILRVSTKKQLSSGDGIENQRLGNNEYIRRRGYRLLDEVVIAETADDKERRDFEAALNSIVARKREVDLVVFWKMDRVSRAGVGTYYALKAYLAKHGVRIEFATEQIDATPAGELMESMLAATARFENRLRVDRTIGVERILTREGYWCRAAPTGFVNGRTDAGKPILLPHPDPRQWELLRYGLMRQLTGAYKVRQVADELREQGLITRSGNPLTRQTWTKICRAPVYGGMLCGPWTDYQFVRAKFDGPLTPDEWRRLQEVLDGRNTVARRLPRQASRPEFPLRRFLRCPKCRTPARGYHAVKKNDRRYSYYDCRNRACEFRIPAAEAHRMFVDLLRDVTPSPELLALFREVVLEVWESEHRELLAKSIDVNKTAGRFREEKQALIGLMKANADNPSLVAELRADYERVERALALATLARDTAEMEEYEAEAVVNHCVYFLERAGELWQEWPVDLQNRLQLMVFPRGVGFDVLEGLSNPDLSLVHAVFADSARMAAPSCRVTNRVIAELIGWYKILASIMPVPLIA